MIVLLLKKLFQSIRDFIRKAYAHRNPIQDKYFFYGILLLIGSWQLIGVGNAFHEVQDYSWLASLTDYSIQMTHSTGLLLLISMIYFYLKGNEFTYGCQHLKITRDNEIPKDDQVKHLSYGWRIGAIYIRAALATGGYYLFELARVFINSFDNSALHGADALFYALLFGWWVEKKTSDQQIPAYSRRDWIGMGISAGAIICAFFFDAFSSSVKIAFWGVTEGFSSSIALACIILISGIVVYHDSVIRIAFHNCLFGMLVSVFLVVTILFKSYDGQFSELFAVLKTINFKTAILASTCYAFALLGFLFSYRFIQPTLIAMSGNWLGIGTSILLLLFRMEFDFKTLIVTIALVIGSILIGIGEWEKEKIKEGHGQ